MVHPVFNKIFRPNLRQNDEKDRNAVTDDVWSMTDGRTTPFGRRGLIWELFSACNGLVGGLGLTNKCLHLSWCGAALCVH